MDVNEAMIEAVKRYEAAKEDNYRKRVMANRLNGLCKAWNNILRNVNLRQKHLFRLNPAIAIKTVSHYADDLMFLKRRYKISDKAQASKVAGLMASAVLKYRPLVPADPARKDIVQNEANEFLALYNGLCVCAEGIGSLNALILKPQYDEWMKKFMFLLRERNYTSENLVMVFETLCFAAFPDAMVNKVMHE